MSSISVRLSNESLWKEFQPNVEMITRKKPRQLFPRLAYKVQGLDPNAQYSMYIHLERVDDLRYHFVGGQWVEKEDGFPVLPIVRKSHENGANTGEFWMKMKSIEFADLKITHIPESVDANTLLVQSLHKYQPVLTIRRHGDTDNKDEEQQFKLADCQFIPLTMYQDPRIKELKVKHNKFAKRKTTVDPDVHQEQILNLNPVENRKRKLDSSQSVSSASTSPSSGFSPISTTSPGTSGYWNPDPSVTLHSDPAIKRSKIDPNNYHHFGHSHYHHLPYPSPLPIDPFFPITDPYHSSISSQFYPSPNQYPMFPFHPNSQFPTLHFPVDQSNLPTHPYHPYDY